MPTDSDSYGSVLRTARTIHDFARRAACLGADRFLVLECHAADDDRGEPARFVVYDCAHHDCVVTDAGAFLYRAAFDRERPPPEELRTAYERLRELRDHNEA